MSPFQLTPKGFADSWRAGALVQMPSLHRHVAIPADARDFLIQAGLPALIWLFPGPGSALSAEAKITFCRLASGLSPLTDEPTVGPPLPPDWSVYLIMGDEFFCNGGAFWCIDQRDGGIVRIDIERGDPIEIVNSGVALFAQALLAISNWSGKHDRRISELESELNLIDPQVIHSRESLWPRLLSDVRDEESSGLFFEAGSLAEGMRAWKAGSW